MAMTGVQGILVAQSATSIGVDQRTGKDGAPFSVYKWQVQGLFNGNPGTYEFRSYRPEQPPIGQQVSVKQAEWNGRFYYMMARKQAASPGLVLNPTPTPTPGAPATGQQGPSPAPGFVPRFGWGDITALHTAACKYADLRCQDLSKEERSKVALALTQIAATLGIRVPVAPKPQPQVPQQPPAEQQPPDDEPPPSDESLPF